VGLAETDAAVAEIMKKYNLTDESLAESLKVEGFDMEEYKNQLAEQILLTKVVRYEVKTSIVIGDKQIREYYEVYKEKYRKGEKVRIRLIFFAGDAKDNLQKTDIEAKAEEVMQMIETGEDFAKIASEFSEDASKEVGGDLGYVSHGSVLKEIDDVVFDMKNGEVSKPFWSSVGLHIVKLEDRIEGSEVKEIRDEIKGIFFEEAFKLKLEEWVKKLREEAYIEIKL
jgi:parvulin-like peptidyl-prolyl isomerase